jgi:NTE family protein
MEIKKEIIDFSIIVPDTTEDISDKVTDISNTATPETMSDVVNNSDIVSDVVNNSDIVSDVVNNSDIVSDVVHKSKSGDFDTLVLSGGSIHAIVMLGALQYSDDNNLLNKIHRYVGTSAGAMCGYLLAIGYTPIEIMVFLCTKQILEKMKHFNIVAMMNGGGATSFSHIHEQLEKMTIEKIGKVITIGELYRIYNKEFICVTHNLTSDKSEILSYETYPDMPCLIALRMSSNLPFIFDNFKYMDNFYIDGGMSNNFPIDIAEEKGDKILGIAIHNTNRSFREDKNNMVGYMYQLMSIPIKQNVLNRINSVSDKCTVITLQPDQTPLFDFNLDTNTKLDMFSSGYNQIQKYWEKL